MVSIPLWAVTLVGGFVLGLVSGCVGTVWLALAMNRSAEKAKQAPGKQGGWMDATGAGDNGS